MEILLTSWILEKKPWAGDLNCVFGAATVGVRMGTLGTKHPALMGSRQLHLLALPSPWGSDAWVPSLGVWPGPEGFILPPVLYSPR